MGYQKFKLSDMIPNAWFFKLKDMSTTKPSPTLKPKKTRLPPPPPPPSSPPSSAVDTTATLPRKSYHITRDPPISPPRKSKSSTRKHHSTRKSSNTSTNTNTHNQHHRQYSISSSASTTFTCRTTTSTTTEDSPSPPEKPDHFDEDIVFDLELPRIATKPSKPARVSHSSKDQHGNITRSPPSRRFSVSASPGVRLKINSPRIIARKQGQGQGQNGNSSVGGGRKSVSSNSKRRSSVTESFAVVKSSRDPQKDFRESMVEMIVQNNLRGSKDLEDLLACYLSLNSDEYHDVIIKVFKQIWFDFIHHRDRPHKLVSS